MWGVQETLCILGEYVSEIAWCENWGGGQGNLLSGGGTAQAPDPAPALILVLKEALAVAGVVTTVIALSGPGLRVELACALCPRPELEAEPLHRVSGSGGVWAGRGVGTIGGGK